MLKQSVAKGIYAEEYVCCHVNMGSQSEAAAYYALTPASSTHKLRSRCLLLAAPWLNPCPPDQELQASTLCDVRVSSYKL